MSKLAGVCLCAHARARECVANGGWRARGSSSMSVLHGARVYVGRGWMGGSPVASVAVDMCGEKLGSRGLAAPGSILQGRDHYVIYTMWHITRG